MKTEKIAGLGRSLFAAIGAAALVLSTGAGWAKEFPTKAVRIITPPGDTIARLLADRLTDTLGQSVYIENLPSGPIPNETVARAEPDGHTLLMTGHGMWVGPAFREVTYDPLTDFTPVILLSQDANILVVHPSLPVDSVEELVEYAKDHPGELNYASTGIGGSMHLGGELLADLADVDIVRIDYSGGNNARMDVMAGNVQMAVIGAEHAMPLVEGGMLKPLGVSTLEPTELVPGMPPIADTIPGYELVASTAVLAPAGTPAPIVERLNEEINRALADPDFRQQLHGLNQRVIGGPPDVLTRQMEGDIAKWSRIVEEKGLKLD